MTRPLCGVFVRRPRFHVSSAPKEWGGRRSNGHHMPPDPPHGALHVLASVNNGAPHTDGQFVHPSTSVLMRTTGGYKGRSARGVGPNGTSATLTQRGSMALKNRSVQ